MLESLKSLKKRPIINFIKLDNLISDKGLIEKDKKTIKGKRIFKKKNKNMKELENLGNIEVKKEKKTKFSLGEIKIAKIHSKANKPLKQLKDLTKEEIKNNSCPCCGSPTEINGKLEDYKMCDSPDEFFNCGEGIILYFSFFKFCIFVTFIATIGISCVNSYISYNYYYELQKICHYFDDHIVYFRAQKFSAQLHGLEKDSLNYDKIFNICKVYSETMHMRSYRITPVDDVYYERPLLNSFFFKISLVNFRNYKYMSECLKKINLIENDTIINLNIVNFLCIANIFIGYLVYTFFIYNKINALNYSIYTVGDYSIFINNLSDIYKKFEENLEYIQKKENELGNSYQKLNIKLYEEKLGFEPKENIPKLNLFKKFLEKKLFKNYDVKRIDLCYKLKEIINLQKKIEELDEKMERIEFDQSMIKKNNKKGIKGDKRNYYSCCLCCETEESLEQIKMEKKEKEKKMNQLIESSKKGNSSEYFIDAAFITFNNIKEQEDYLNKNNKNNCDRIVEDIITFCKIFIDWLRSYCYCCCCCCLCCCSCCDSDDDKLKKSFNYYKRKIKFQRAPEPEDIIFENFENSFKSKLKNMIGISFVITIIFYLSYMFNSLLYRIQINIEYINHKTVFIYALSFAITIVTSIIDLILEIVLEKLIKCLKFYTLTELYTIYSIWLSIIWFINSCIIPIIYEIRLTTISEEHEILTSNLLTKFLFNSFATTIMWSINIKNACKKFKQFIIEQKEKISYNQKELNELYELQSMNVAAKYSYLVKTLIMSFIFAPIFPLGFCISFFGFIFGYWLEKFNFSKNYKKPEKLGKEIAEFYVNFCSIVFSSFGIGSFFLIGNFKLIISNEFNDYNNNDIWILINIIIYNIAIYIPKCVKKDFFKFKESEIHKKTYDEMYLDFIIDYERANPMTRIEGEMRYLDKLEEKNRLNKIEKDLRKKKIKEGNPIKFYLEQQRMSRIINIKELSNLLNLDVDEQEKEKDIFPKIENYKNKKQKKNTGRSSKIIFNNETGISIQKVKEEKTTIKSTYQLFKIHNNK